MIVVGSEVESIDEVESKSEAVSQPLVSCSSRSPAEPIQVHPSSRFEHGTKQQVSR